MIISDCPKIILLNLLIFSSTILLLSVHIMQIIHCQKIISDCPMIISDCQKLISVCPKLISDCPKMISDCPKIILVRFFIFI